MAWRRLCRYGISIAAMVVNANAAFADDAAIGREIFHEKCAACHGKDMVSPGGLAFDLRKFPPDQADRFRQSVRKGTPKGMPAWESQLSADDIDALWDYVKSGG